MSVQSGATTSLIPGGRGNSKKGFAVEKSTFSLFQFLGDFFLRTHPKYLSRNNPRVIAKIFPRYPYYYTALLCSTTTYALSNATYFELLRPQLLVLLVRVVFLHKLNFRGRRTRSFLYVEWILNMLLFFNLSLECYFHVTLQEQRGHPYNLTSLFPYFSI